MPTDAMVSLVMEWGAMVKEERHFEVHDILGKAVNGTRSSLPIIDPP